MPVQTGPDAHPPLNISGLNRPGRDADHPPPSREEVENELELYLLLSGLHSLVMG